ncbi:unnamed protein product, partial [Dicrocoelium dendriticum]
VSVSIDRSLCIFNRCDTTFLTALGLRNIVNPPTRSNATLVLVFVNNVKWFILCTRTPIGNSDHSTIKLSPGIYSKNNHQQTTRCNTRRVRWRQCSPQNLDRLREMIASTELS